MADVVEPGRGTEPGSFRPFDRRALEATLADALKDTGHRPGDEGEPADDGSTARPRNPFVRAGSPPGPGATSAPPPGAAPGGAPPLAPPARTDPSLLTRGISAAISSGAGRSVSGFRAPGDPGTGGIGGLGVRPLGPLNPSPNREPPEPPPTIPLRRPARPGGAPNGAKAPPELRPPGSPTSGVGLDPPAADHLAVPPGTEAAAPQDRQARPDAGAHPSAPVAAWTAGDDDILPHGASRRRSSRPGRTTVGRSRRR
jgi:hypothetical protein